ncbi:MAG: glycolate oxidase subunit GlcE [Gammaproteobacteria bacterium]
MDEAVERLAATIRDAADSGRPLAIRGAGSKDFLGHPVAADTLSTADLRGIVAYEPSELVVTVRAGTPLAEVEAALAGEGQMLAFEPPRLAPESTIGGALAAGLSGPARPFRGAARDFVLGCRVLDGRGRQLVFGGQVMKNVAGYDVSRLLTGSMGCLAVLLEVSLKVLPRPATDLSVALECSEDEAIDTMCRLGGRALPLSAAAWADGVLRLRLSGARAAVAAARTVIGGETTDAAYWEAVRDQRTGNFLSSLPLWRVSVPAATPPLDLPGSPLIDWGGAQRWIATEAEAEVVRAAAGAAGGHATRYRGGDPRVPAFHPLPEPLLALHRRLKAALDPAGILNPGRLYASL